MSTVRKSLHLFACLASLSMGDIAIAGEAPPVAMVTDVKGLPALPLLSEIAKGTHVRLDSGASASIVYLQSGQEYELSGPSEVEIGAEAPRALKGKAPVKHGAALSRSREAVRIDPVKVTQGALVMRGPAQAPQLRMDSLSDTTTLDARPRFEWTAATPGLRYRIDLIDGAGKKIFSIPVEQSPALLPEDVSLLPDADYTWLLTAIGPGGESYESAGDFKVASDELRARVEGLRPAADASVSERVVFAAWLEQMHLRDEARKVWKTIAAERKDEPRLQVLAGE